MLTAPQRSTLPTRTHSIRGIPSRRLDHAKLRDLRDEPWHALQRRSR